MVDLACEHARDAGAADALQARNRDFHADSFESFGNSVRRRDAYNLPGAVDDYIEAAVGPGLERRVGEVFKMNLLFGQAFRRGRRADSF